MSKEKEITSTALTELELVTLNEAFQLVHNKELYLIEDAGKTWINDELSIQKLSDKMDKMMDKVRAAQPIEAMFVE
jgi:hypothetical protein